MYMGSFSEVQSGSISSCEVSFKAWRLKIKPQLERIESVRPTE